MTSGKREASVGGPHTFRSVQLSSTIKLGEEQEMPGDDDDDGGRNDKSASSRVEKLIDPSDAISDRLSSAFFGRSREKVALLRAYESNLDSWHDDPTLKTSFVLIKGAKGVGKSFLLEKTLKERVTSDAAECAGAGAGAYYITYRFDQYQRSHLTRIFDEAFEDFVRQCAARGPAEMALVKRLIGESSELHIESIIQVVPAMKRILLTECASGEEFENSSSLGQSARRSGLLRGFLRAISKERPIVFVFENWQWAHKATLDILNGIVPPLKDSRILFVATYRPDCEPFFQLPSVGDDEVDDLVEKWEKNGVGVRRLELEPLVDTAVLNLVSHVLRRPGVSDECHDVSHFVCETVDGNPSHAVELLRSICGSEMVVLDVQAGRLTLERDTERFVRLSAKSIHGLLEERIELLSPDTQKMLKVAAVFGCDIDEMLLSHALGNSPETKVPLEVYLEEAAMSEVLERHPNHGCCRYRFGSNLMQEAAYSFIEQTKRKGFHVALGRQLWKSMTMEEVNDNLAKVLFQINLGTDLITNQLERYALASLMHSLGSRAAKHSSFVGGAFLLEKALNLLGEDCWYAERELCLAIYNTLAETTYAIGDFDRVSYLVKEIFHHADSVDERLQAHCTYVFMLTADNKMAAALDEGLCILRELGEPLPKRPSWLQMHLSRRSVDRKMRGKSLDSLLRLPAMTDNRKLACMKLMNILFSPAYMINPLLASLLCNRMMELTLEYGSCTITSCVLSLRGMLLCGHDRRVEEGYEYGQLALRMLDKYKTKEYLPRVFAGVYGEINPFTRPIEGSLEPLWQSVVTAMETGDIEFGILNSNVYCALAFHVGSPLSDLKERLDRVRQDMVLLNQKSLQAFNIPILETVNLLRGSSVESFDASEAIASLPTSEAWILGHMCLRTFILGDHETAATCGKQFLHRVERTFRSLDDLLLSSFASLALVTDWKRQKKSRRRRHVVSLSRSSIKLLKKASTHAPDFCLSKLHLLKAELCTLEKKPDKAYGHYTMAVAMGVKTGYLIDEAVASECAGHYMLSGEGKQKWAAITFLEQALDAYQRWGANAKVRHLESVVEEARRDSTLSSSLSR